MIIQPLKFGDKKLLRIAQPIDDFSDPELNKIIENLWDTMAEYKGVGISAPQIGVNLRLFVYGFESNPRYPTQAPIPKTVIINPTITPLTNEITLGWEGCLSVPGLRGKVARITQLKLNYFDQNGKNQSRMADGFHARVIQHEVDHLDGILFPMKLAHPTQFGFEDVLAFD